MPKRNRPKSDNNAATDTDLNALLGEVAELPEREQQILVNAMTPTVRRTMEQCWQSWAHEGQYPDDSDWRVWLIMAGRGFGKTRAGAEWVSQKARENPDAAIALVGANLDDVRKVMIEGPSGLLAVAHAGQRPQWIEQKGELRFASGAVAHIYSAEAHEKLRGPEHGFAWCDELGKWNNGTDCWHNLLLGLRVGATPQVVATTTPRNVELLHKLVEEPGVILRGGKTGDNDALPETYLQTMLALYGGTRFGRQEIDGELLTDHEDALWTRDLLERCRVKAAPECKRIVIGVDPPASKGGDACGIVVVGKGADGKAYVLADHSVKGRLPEGWARAVAAAVEVHGADRVVAEANQGGDMVVSTLLAADPAMPVQKVNASRAKAARAEPVMMLYRNGRAFHAGAFPELEDEMCGLVSGGDYQGPGRSPDRADALVWAMSELMLGKQGVEPRIRQL